MKSYNQSPIKDMMYGLEAKITMLVIEPFSQKSFLIKPCS